jgi:hypothetical protein
MARPIGGRSRNTHKPRRRNPKSHNIQILVWIRFPTVMTFKLHECYVREEQGTECSSRFVAMATNIQFPKACITRSYSVTPKAAAVTPTEQLHRNALTCLTVLEETWIDHVATSFIYTSETRVKCLPINGRNINERAAEINFYLTRGKRKVKCATPKIMTLVDWGTQIWVAGYTFAARFSSLDQHRSPVRYTTHRCLRSSGF